MKPEWFARLIVLFLVLGVVAVAATGWLLRPKTPLLHVRLAESGGWTPESLKAVVGQPLHLRLTSDDVLHSFSVGQIDMEPVEVMPGEISSVSLTFERPGKYAFYCTRWCGVNHWRMRGVIEVSGPAGETVTAEPPLYLALGLDIDAERTMDVPLPAANPFADAGEKLGLSLPPELDDRQVYLTKSPAEVFMTLKSTPGLMDLPDQQLWNLVALLWKNQITNQALENGKELYARNCAACHGEQGGGDGVFSDELALTGSGEHSGMVAGEMTQSPADFKDAARMLSASSALLQGKIIRGGMGTGMPYWGPIFTEEQTWDLVAYLWSFQFDLEVKE